jgi:ADP-ribose pyrophosphatase
MIDVLLVAASSRPMGFSMRENDGEQIVYEGRYLSMAVRDGWEFATRKNRSPAVGIVAITDDDRVLLVEQHRPPVGRSVIELPAGLSGDVVGAEGESLVEAAKRELWEETGYRAESWVELGLYYSSPGLTDESIVLFLADSLRKEGEAGGDETESITVHEVPFAGVLAWLELRGVAADLKTLAGLHAARCYRENSRM